MQKRAIPSPWSNPTPTATVSRPCPKPWKTLAARTWPWGTVEEGAYLRQTGFTGRILALLGSQSARDDQTCLQHNILPFVGHSEQFKRIAEAAGKKPDRL